MGVTLWTVVYQQQQLMSSTMNKSVVASAVKDRMSNVERIAAECATGGKYANLAPALQDKLMAQAELDDAAFNRVMFS